MPSPETQAESEKGVSTGDGNPASWMLTLRVGFAVVFVDAFIRWTELRSTVVPQPNTWSSQDAQMFARIFLGCFVETAGFHAGIMMSSFLLLAVIDRVTLWGVNLPTASRSGVRSLLRYSHIPLCLLYSSATKFFLLFLLAVWELDAPVPHSSMGSLPPSYKYTIHSDSPFFQAIWESLDDDKLDRRWVVRNVMGGMATGFGLRVVLDCHPSLTTIVIAIGWAVKTGIATVVGKFVDQSMAEAWLAYSLP